MIRITSSTLQFPSAGEALPANGGCSGVVAGA
jgi:hypothetical protein